jgi:signal transduction histidine kinase
VLDREAGPVSGDPDRLQQVIWNLLSNALKFTPKVGTVSVRLQRVNSHVEILVSDTGQGIAPEFLPYVFERFRQAEGADSPRQGGLVGLGRQSPRRSSGSMAARSASRARARGKARPSL